MSVSGISSYSAHSSSGQAAEGTKGFAAPDKEAELQELIDYFNMPASERIIKNWLEAHGITEEEYEAMTPDQKEALKRQMTTDIRDRAERKNEEKAKAMLDVLI